MTAKRTARAESMQAPLALRVDGEEERQPEEAWERTLYTLLTNRYNLLDILSSGLIKPRLLMGKYYNDLGSACPGAVPLLTRNPSQALIEQSVGNDPLVFPVVLDIDVTGLQGRGAVVRDDYSLEQADLPLEESALCVLVPGVVPATRVRTVHFRSEGELEEHRARQYANVWRDGVELRVSPERFDGVAVDAQRLRQALAEASQDVLHSQPEQFRVVEALGGALLMAGGLAERDQGLSLQALVPALTAIRSAGETGRALQAAASSGRAASWLALIVTTLLEEISRGYEVETSTATQAVVGAIRTSENRAAALLLQMAVRTLVRLTPDEYYSEDALATIRAEFEAELPHVLTDEIDSLLAGFQDVLDSMQDVLANMMDAAAFPAEQVPVASGLLHFLMRDRPDRAMSWVTETRRPPSDVLAVAVALSGVLYGRSVIPIECRPRQEYERYLDEIVAWHADQLTPGIVFPSTAGTLRVEEEERAGGKAEVLYGPGGVLLERRNTPTVVPEAPREKRTARREPEEKRAPKTPAKQRRGTGIRRITRDELVRQQLLDAELTAGPEKEAAVWLCREAGWDQCVESIVPLAGRKGQRLENVGYLVVGFVTPEIRIRVREFRAQLTEENWAVLPEETRKGVEAMLTEKTPGVKGGRSGGGRRSTMGATGSGSKAGTAGGDS